MGQFPIIKTGHFCVNESAKVVPKGDEMRATIKFDKPFNTVPKVFACWNDNNGAINDYCYMITIVGSSVTKDGFIVGTKAKIDNVYQWYFDWIAIGC